MPHESGLEVSERKSDADGDGLEVVSVEFLDAEEEVFDIQVEHDHSFVVCGAVVHNCQVCASLDRREFAIDKGPRPPRHPNCRCTTVPVLKREFAFLSEGGTRASAGAGGGKQVDAGLDYFEWLKLQPRSFIDVAIGPARAKLLLDGGLSAGRFAALQLDRRFEPLTLAEMKKIEPIAFARAGL